jgi:hypothetical protein
MKIKLLHHIMEEGKVKASVRQSGVTPFVEGAVIEVGAATGKKYVEKGWAEEVKADGQQEETRPQVETVPDTPVERPARDHHEAAPPADASGPGVRRGRGRGPENRGQ